MAFLWKLTNLFNIFQQIRPQSSIQYTRCELTNYAHSSLFSLFIAFGLSASVSHKVMHSTQTDKHIKHAQTAVDNSCVAHLLDTQLLQTKARSKSQFCKQGRSLLNNLPKPLGFPAELGWQFFSVWWSSQDKTRVYAPFPQLHV